MKQGVPAPVLAERLAFLLRTASLHAHSGQDEATKRTIEEAQTVLDQLKEAI